MQEKKTDIKKAILHRVHVLYILFFLLGLAIAGKIVYIQYGPHGEELRKRAVRISYERVTVEADRGDVLSWDGRILATSVPMYEVRMDFAAQGLVDSVFNKQVDSLAYCLSNFFGDKSKQAYRTMLENAYRNKKKNRYTQISPRRVNHLEIKEISRFPLLRLGPNRGGFITVQVNKRLHPHDNMALRTIGTANDNGVRLGVEGAFDSVLRGVNGNMLMQRISGSFRIPVPDELSVNPVDGIDVVTTLDIDLQDVAEKALRDQLELQEADWGTAILMEVATGEIRAITNLTRKGPGRCIEDFNYAMGWNAEPGSTFKLASLMALLDDAGASLDEVYETGNGSPVRIGRATVRDDHAYGTLTLRGVFEKSSNVGFALAVNKYYKDNPKGFVNHLYRMGLAEPLQMQIKGEQQAVIRKPGDRYWDGTTLTMMAYGYAVQLTPLKTLTLYNAIANDGKMMRPLLVKELRQYGQTLKTYAPDVMVPSVAKPETLKAVQQAMRGVVEEGTGRVLKSPYYSVAGKTGTAQQAMGRSGYKDRFGGRRYLATIVGYFPADNPKYSCLVAVQTYFGNGRYKTYYGASLAGPVFRAIADRVYAQNTAWQSPVSDREALRNDVPFVKSGRTEQVREVTSRFDVPYNGARERKGWETVAVADSSGLVFEGVGVGTGLVPNVVGMGVKDALFLLEREGLVVAFSGVGCVQSQSLPAGSRAQRGGFISLKLGADPPVFRKEKPAEKQDGNKEDKKE